MGERWRDWDVSGGKGFQPAYADTLVETYRFAGLMGLAGTGINTLAPLMWAASYGRGSLGAIHGVGRASQALGFAIGPLAAGMAYDATGGYREAFLALAGVALVAATAGGTTGSRHRQGS